MNPLQKLQKHFRKQQGQEQVSGCWAGEDLRLLGPSSELQCFWAELRGVNEGGTEPKEFVQSHLTSSVLPVRERAQPPQAAMLSEEMSAPAVLPIAFLLSRTDLYLTFNLTEFVPQREGNNENKRNP